MTSLYFTYRWLHLLLQTMFERLRVHFFQKCGANSVAQKIEVVKISEKVLENSLKSTLAPPHLVNKNQTIWGRYWNSFQMLNMKIQL